MDYLKAFLSFVVGLFLGQLVLSIIDLFGMAGPLITGLYVFVILVLFLINEALRKYEMKHLLRFIGRIANEPVSAADIEKNEVASRLDRRFLLLGACIGALISAKWGTFLLSDLVPFL